jgi:hypothetical protein
MPPKTDEEFAWPYRRPMTSFEVGRRHGFVQGWRQRNNETRDLFNRLADEHRRLDDENRQLRDQIAALAQMHRVVGG